MVNLLQRKGGDNLAKPKLGSGGRFKALTNKLEKQGKSADSAKAIAAVAGIKKYGVDKMAKMAAAGKTKVSKRK